MWRYAAVLLLLPLAAFFHLQLASGLPFDRQWAVIVGAAGDSFEALEFGLSALPRLVMAILVGAAMGLSGSVLQ